MAAENSEHSDTFHHVRDFPYLELPGKDYMPIEGLEKNRLPMPSFDIPGLGEFQISKFMLLQVVAGLLTLLIFFVLARKVRKGEPVRGRFWNFWEAIVLYLRDQVVRPTIGTGHHHPEEYHHPGDVNHHDHTAESMYAHYDGDKEAFDHIEQRPAIGHAGTVAVEVGHPADVYLPFVLTCFFYVLFCNLLGAFPWLGSATGNLNVTGALALVVFGYVIFVGSKASGVVGFWKSLAPHMDVPGLLQLPLTLGIWVIEFVGLIIKHGVLAVRLFANIMAGHTVIAAILGFIALAAHSSLTWLFYAVAPASVLGQVGIGLLELFVAFLQAYVFAFLAALFISAAVHPH